MTRGESSKWWRTSVGYLIYLRSFADTTGNGVGDLAGVSDHLDHLADLGVDLLWVTPFFPSPMADFGYDVSDYVEVAPIYGSMADLDQLVADVHARDMRLIIDLVPNHTSVEHPWFQQSRQSRENPLRSRYLWADPAPDGSAPNNWVSYFGGSAWTLDERSGQYYLHLFLPAQPDLNWRDPTLVEQFDHIIRFWLDRGVDGFRIDVAQALVKDIGLRSNPVVGPLDSTAHRDEQWAAFQHDHDVLQPESLEIFRRWKSLCAEEGAILVGETYVTDPRDYAGLMGDGGFDAGFWFAPLHMKWDRDEIELCLRQPLEALDDPSRIGWLTSSQDLPRAPSRLGGGQEGRERSLLLAMLMFALPGLPFLYQGEELGLTDGVVAPELRHDPVSSDVDPGRDGCRTPMPWKPGPTLGFSESETPWLPTGQRSVSETVSDQEADDRSWLARYRRLVSLRRDEHLLSSDAAVQWIPTAEDRLLVFTRGDIAVVANVSDQPAQIDLLGDVLFNTHHHLGSAGSRLELVARQGLVLRSSRPILL